MEIYALDGLTQIDRLTRYTRVEQKERDLATGSWQVEIPVDSAEATVRRLKAATWPGIELWDPDTNWRFGGFLTSITSTKDRSGRRIVRLVGADFQTDLQLRLDWPDAAVLSNWWSQVYGGTIPLTSDAHNMMHLNAGAGAVAQRQMAYLTFGTDPGTGTPKARRIKGIPLLEVLAGMFTGEDSTARLRLVRPSAAVNSIQFDTPARQLSTVIVDGRDGRYGNLTVTETADTATFVIGMGAEIVPGTLPDRFVALAAINNTDWRSRHIETFLNRPSTNTQARLLDECTTHLNGARRRRKVQVDAADVEGYGADVDLGWYIDVTDGDSFNATVDRLPVVASTLTYTHQTGWRRTVDLGTEFYDRREDSIIDAVTRLARRVRHVETELTP